MAPSRPALERIPLDALHRHPRNPHKPGGKALAALAESLRAQGQLEPLLVRPLEKGGFEILAGHRRVEALSMIGAEAADAIVRPSVSDAEALAILLAANEQREDVDPFMEAIAVRELVDLEGSVVATATRLGMSPRWVAGRLSLLSLSETWSKRRLEDPWRSWTLGHWLQLARLSPDAQDALAKDGAGRTSVLLEDEALPVSTLEEIVDERLRELRRAPFDLEARDLVRGCPPCSACPKTSQSVPGLFDDGAPTDLKNAVCRDPYCWRRKAAATVRNRIAEARTKVAGDTSKPDEVVVVAKGYTAPKGAGRAVSANGWEPAKEGSKGAVQAVIVGEGGGVTTGYVKLLGGRSASAAPAPAPKKESPEALLARLEQEHAAAVDLAVDRAAWDWIEGDGPVALRPLLALVLLVGSYPFGSESKKDGTRLGRTLELAADLADGKAFDEAALVAVLRPAVAMAVDYVSHDWRGAFDRILGKKNGERAWATLLRAAGFTPARQAELRAAVKPSAELLAARAAGKQQDLSAKPSKAKGAGKGAAAGDRDAAAADAAPAPKKAKAGKGAR